MQFFLRLPLITILICILSSACTEQVETLNLTIDKKTTIDINKLSTTLSTPSASIENVISSNPCSNDAIFISDLTIPDFSQITSNTIINKSWKLRNTGTCDWGTGYSVAFKEGNAMTTKLQHGLYPAIAGSHATIEIQMKTPELPGDYVGFWLLYDPEGNAFGPQLYIKISVTAD
tara:strand:- start:93 stop:617 length:525 start_codon:yes stop_codon:yes gene_type:complete